MRTLTLCVLLALAAPAAAGTLKVPAQFDTIALALAAAEDGDTISVSKGLYLGSVEVGVPNVKLVGKKAVIDARYLGDCLTVTAPGVTVSGFTLVNGMRGLVATGAGITVTRCVMTLCKTDGLLVNAAPATITSNTITKCGLAGIRYEPGMTGHTVIDRNVLRNYGLGITVLCAGDLELTRNRCEWNGNTGMEIVLEPQVPDGALLPEAPLVVDRNDCIGNAEGLIVFNVTGVAVIVRRNTCVGNIRGMELYTAHATVEDNRIDDSWSDGLIMLTDHSVITGNSVSGNKRHGMMIGGIEKSSDGDDVGGTGDENVVKGNIANDNGQDGMRLERGAFNQFIGNQASGNGSDGFDIDHEVCSGTLVDGNNFSSNAHEGLDNGGTATVITNNTCRKNSRGLGPDIAGRGDNAAGTTASFAGNTFDTGGELASAELDSYVNTLP